MKKLTFIIMAGLMALGLTQCKKNEQPANIAEDSDRVSISLKIANVGQKVNITEEGTLAYVNFDNGDVMYVGSDGKYVGYLTYTNGLFTGSISAEATEGEPLQFIMMGGRNFHESLTENLSTECTFSLSDQSTSLAVVSTEASNEPFSLTNLSYTSYLRNKCALVKFDLGSVSTDVAITLTGMKNEVTVGFDGTVANGTATGDITTNGTGSTRYAVVLSDQEAVTEGILTAEGYEGTFTMPAAFTNAYLTNTSMTLTETATTDRNTPLTFEAVTAGSTVTFTAANVYPMPSLEYKINDGAWTTYSSGTAITLANVGDKVSFRGDNTTFAIMNFDFYYSKFSCTGSCYLYGNIMSLLNKDNFSVAETLTHDYTFRQLFYENTAISNHPEKEIILPATTLSRGCYFSMFCGCIGLTSTPELPATTLSNECYRSMFKGCNNLIMAPELPGTTLDQSCYREMFRGCTGLTTAPALSATTLVEGCYAYMFSDCTGLSTAPTLPVTTLASQCYEFMFYGCTALTLAPVLPATTLASRCYQGMFADCTSLTMAPELPATTLASECYDSMFAGCTGLTTAPVLPATTMSSLCYAGMFEGCTALSTAPALPAMTLDYGCYIGMFRDCIGLTTASVLPATTLATYCYMNMYQGCSNLRSVKCLATNISADYCTSTWLHGVASTGTFTKAAGVNWPSGSSGIPTGWTILQE